MKESAQKGRALRSRDSACEYHSPQATEQSTGLPGHVPKGTSSSAFATGASKGDLFYPSPAPSLLFMHVSKSRGDRP